MSKDSHKQLFTLESIEAKIQKKKNELKALERQRDKSMLDAIKRIMNENSMKTKDFFEYLQVTGLFNENKDTSKKENSAQVEQNS